MSGMQTRRHFLKRCGAAMAALAAAPAAARAAWQPAAGRVSDIGYLEDTLTVLHRSEWTSLEPSVWRLREAQDFTRITVHHSGSRTVYEREEEDVISILDGVLNSHRRKGYGDIGYHFVIDYAGRAWEARSLAYEGAHVSGENERNIGVMLLGNFERQRASQAQLDATDELIHLLRRRYDIGREHVYGHRDLGHSLCPGLNLYRHIEQLRA